MAAKVVKVEGDELDNVIAMSAEQFRADVRELASKPSDGSILRTLAIKMVGAGIAATVRGEEKFDARPVWEKEFVPVFYVGDRKRPGTDENGKLKGEDQYGNALVKLGNLGAFINWKEIDDRKRVARWIAEQKQPGESYMMSMPNMGALANALMDEFDKTAPTDKELADYAKKKATARRNSTTSSELKAASVVLVNAIGKIGTAKDFLAVCKDDPALAKLAIEAKRAVEAYGVAAAAYFKARKAVEDAAKPKKGTKGKGKGKTAAQRNVEANAKFAALLAPAADGSNGVGTA